VAPPVSRLRPTGTAPTHVVATSPLLCCMTPGTCSMMPALPARPPVPLLATGIANTHVAPPVPRLRPTGTPMTHMVTGTATETMLTGTPQSGAASSKPWR